MKKTKISLEKENEVWVATCKKTGVSTYGDTMEETLRNLGEAIKCRLDTEQDVRIENALEAAVAAIYFKDNSDYLPALWDVVRSLDKKTAKLLEKNPLEAYDLTINYKRDE